jgi:ADP-ribose pyrophosphatase
MATPMKPIRVEVPFATPWFQVVAKTLREGEDAWYSLRLPDYAATLAVTPEGRVVLVRQYRPAAEKTTLELPSGLVDEGEPPETAARRELLEETGYEAAEVELLGPLLPDTGRLGNRIWCCAARGLRRADDWKAEEGIEVVLASPAELKEAIAGGRFDHALHVAVVLLAGVRGKFELP